MTPDQITTFVILAITVVLFIWDKWRYDVVALVALFLAVITGLVPAEKAFTGFADPVVITVACILVLSASISRSGFIDLALKAMAPFIAHKHRQVALMAGMVMGLSAFINNVGALAVFLPIALSFARKAGRSPSDMLMPMSFASLLGGLITLIGTPPNLLISNMREDFLGKPYEMFDFAPVGLAISAIGLVYLAFGWHLLPKDRRGQAQPEDRFAIEDYLTEVLVNPDSPLIGQTVRGAEQGVEGELAIVGIVRDGHRTLIPSGRSMVKEGDILIVKADPVTLKTLVDKLKVTLTASKESSNTNLTSEDIGIMEAVIRRGSELIGSTPRELELRRRYGFNLLAVRQENSQRAPGRLRDSRFHEGDIILLQGPIENMNETLQELDCLPLAERNLLLGRPKTVFMPPLIMLVAVLLTVCNVLPVSIAFMGGVLAIAILKVMRLNEMYEAIDWPIIILLGAMIPVAGTMQSTGGAELLATWIADFVQGMPPYLTLGSVMVATMLITPFLNNAATVLLMAPLAANLANNMGLAIDPFLMAVAIGASCDFLTPIGHQSNTLVMGPGGYKFTDYWRMGLPLSILVVVVGVPLLMWAWPVDDMTLKMVEAVPTHIEAGPPKAAD